MMQRVLTCPGYGDGSGGHSICLHQTPTSKSNLNSPGWYSLFLRTIALRNGSLAYVTRNHLAYWSLIYFPRETTACCWAGCLLACSLACLPPARIQISDGTYNEINESQLAEEASVMFIFLGEFQDIRQ
ncbi:hypothetical protein M0802_003733 [Mischocyttarus mexicanus]|nr:hypothetical protein M0802_003733 [Mischocyttarus mexicanus]